MLNVLPVPTQNAWVKLAAYVFESRRLMAESFFKDGGAPILKCGQAFIHLRLAMHVTLKGS